MKQIQAVLAALIMIAPAAAIGQAQRPMNNFTGVYAGPEFGAHEHHFYIKQTDPRTNQSSGRYYRGWGVGGGAFAGYDLAAGERVRLGVEAGVSVGGNNPVARFSDGTSFTQHPRYGYRATAKAGYLLDDRLLAYGTLGYGGHRYRLRGTTFVEGARQWQSSFTIGAGFQYRLSDRVDLRLDFRHLDNSMSHLLIGIPVRF